MVVNERVHVRLALLALLLAGCGETTDAALEQRGDDEAVGGDAPDEDEASGEADEDGAPVGRARDAGAGSADAAAQRDNAGSGDRGDSAVPSTRDAAAPIDARRDAGAVADGGAAPLAALCAETASWDAQATAFEDQVLELTNQARAQGHDCDAKGVFKPTGPVTMDPKLRCAARLHSKYMASTGDFAHDQSATGKGVDARLRDVGYRYAGYGENIAYGQRTPAEVVAGWLDSDGHCAIMMSPSFKHIGIGYATRSSGGRATPYWTQDYGTSR